jgi:hypothetical protein
MASKRFMCMAAAGVAISVLVVPLRGQALIRLPQETKPVLALCITSGCGSSSHVRSFETDPNRRSGFNRAQMIGGTSTGSRKSSGRGWKITLGALIGIGAGILAADLICPRYCTNDSSRAKLYVGLGGIGAVVGGFTGYIISAPKQ